MDLASWWIAYSFAFVSLTKDSGRFTGGLSNEHMQEERWGRGRTDLCSHRTLERQEEGSTVVRKMTWHEGQPGMLVDWMWIICHMCSSVWTLGPQLAGGALRKFVEPSGGGALLEEVSQWGQALRFDNLTPLPVHSASWQLVCCDQPASCFYHHAFPSMRERSLRLMARIPTYLNSLLIGSSATATRRITNAAPNSIARLCWRYDQ